VLVALAILAISMGFAFRVFSGALNALAGSEREQTAMTLAQSMMDRVGGDIALRDGSLAGQTGDGFLWQLRMTPYDSARDCRPGACGAALRGIVVQVSVGWIEQRHTRQVQLSTLRLTGQGG